MPKKPLNKVILPCLGFNFTENVTRVKTHKVIMTSTVNPTTASVALEKIGLILSIVSKVSFFYLVLLK